MLNIMLCGCGGRMGAALGAAATAAGDRIVAGVDINPTAANTYPVYTSPEEFCGHADVIVDFSHHAALSGLLAYATRTATPIVVCTTGHSDEELAEMKAAAATVPIFFSRNMSLGINLLMALCRKAAATLGADFDVEIIEKHHNQKLDAPSGTALMLADALCEVRPEATVNCGRSGQGKRTQGEIGIHAIRMGNIVGEHEVMIGTPNQTITLKHEAHSRALFAEGALAAAAFLVGKEAGIYDMKSLISGTKIPQKV